DHLIDGDLASNAGNWQWVAGTGLDAAPYFRIFNPELQARRFDPDGAYVARWAPDRPAPMLDLAAARRRALAAYQAPPPPPPPPPDGPAAPAGGGGGGGGGARRHLPAEIAVEGGGVRRAGGGGDRHDRVAPERGIQRCWPDAGACRRGRADPEPRRLGDPL